MKHIFNFFFRLFLAFLVAKLPASLACRAGRPFWASPVFSWPISTSSTIWTTAAAPPGAAPRPGTFPHSGAACGNAGSPLPQNPPLLKRYLRNLEENSDSSSGLPDPVKFFTLHFLYFVEAWGGKLMQDSNGNPLE